MQSASSSVANPSPEPEETEPADPCPADTVDADEPIYPEEQLKLVHTEVDRLREGAARTAAAMTTRGSLLVAASGLVSTFQLALLGTSQWRLLYVILALGAAGIGLWTLRPGQGKELDAEKLFTHLEEHPYSVEYLIVSDNLRVLADDRARLKRTSRWILWGFITLAVSWTTPLVIKGVEQLLK